MKRIVFILIALVFLSVSNVFSQSENGTTILFIRHAEKVELSGLDPELTEEGKERASQWAEVFKETGISAIYSTKTKRTLETAKPISQATNIPIKLYGTKTLDIKKLAQSNKGKTILIVGHSNTIPKFINTLMGEETYQQIDDDVYGNLYVVTVIKNKATVGLLQIRK